MIEELFLKLQTGLRQTRVALTPYARRGLRLLALPVCCLKLAGSEECRVSRARALLDMLYIFFRLKYLPENYVACRMWEWDRRDWPLFYGSIYDSYQRGRLRREVQPEEYKILFDDKHLCQVLCAAAGLPVPRLIGRADSDEELRRLVQSALAAEPDLRLILKPLIGSGGKGVVVAWRQEGRILVRRRQETVPLEVFHMGDKTVVQEFLTQHPGLSSLFPHSLNTVRILTLMCRDRRILRLGGYVRCGLGDAYVDNVSQGGVSIGIEESTGRLVRLGIDGRARKYDAHPTTGQVFEGFPIPLWDQVKELAERTQQAFPCYRFLGMDIGVTPGGPVVVEINASPDTIGLEQCCGPILANEEVRREFRRYGLLVNRLCPP